jgi:hypothetical protein
MGSEKKREKKRVGGLYCIANRTRFEEKSVGVRQNILKEIDNYLFAFEVTLQQWRPNSLVRLLPDELPLDIVARESHA